MKKLRLLFTPHCDRNCKMCCNKNWDLSQLPLFDECDIIDTTMYDEILITGGEPLLYPTDLYNLCEDLKFWNSGIKIYVYTAYTKTWTGNHLELFDIVDGFTVTIHDQKSADEFFYTETKLRRYSDGYSGKSMRLNVFENIKLHMPTKWIIKDNLVWLKDCQLPTNEVFMRF